MTNEELMAELNALKAENESLKHKAKTKDGRVVTQNGLTLAVGKAGGLSIYGIGRFPVTLYKGQWERLVAASPEILEYLKAHESEFKVKEPKEEKKVA
jgi:hypothetical protein